MSHGAVTRCAGCGWQEHKKAELERRRVVHGSSHLLEGVVENLHASVDLIEDELHDMAAPLLDAMRPLTTMTADLTSDLNSTCQHVAESASSAIARRCHGLHLSAFSAGLHAGLGEGSEGAVGEGKGVEEGKDVEERKGEGETKGEKEAQTGGAMHRACNTLKLASSIGEAKETRLPATWHALTETPGQEALLQEIVGDDANKKAMEMVGDLVSRTANETIAEITTSAVRTQIVSTTCSHIDGWLN
ncbi:MAG: hypothetical protein SGPRY_002152, partial [Prymnesium sp.]